MKNIRLHFSKTFDVRYISHLDLTRVFSRAVRQSRLPFWYTEGFNTHLYLTFSLPLSLGFESICETVDLRLLDDDMPFDALFSINGFLPYGLEIFNCAPPKHKTGEIGFARYIVELDDLAEGPRGVASILRELYSRDSICVAKKTKSGEKTVDIKPMIHSFSVESYGDRCALDVTVSAGSDGSLNPSLIVGELERMMGHEADHCLIKRVQVLTKSLEVFE